MEEEDDIITQTHNTVLQIFNKVKSKLEQNPKYQDFKDEFDKVFKETFNRIENNRLLDIKYGYYDQEFTIDYIVNAIPVKITDDIHGIGVGIMMGILHRLS